jgi:hypothetical protein
MLLIPKEHGAYGQMAFPIVTSLAVAGVTAPALLITLAVVAAFLAHEPLLVLLGKRGARAKREHGRQALWWFAGTFITAAAAGVGAYWLASPAVRWSLPLPAAPALAVAAAIPAGREKGAAAEIGVALAFSAVAVPVCLAAGANAGTAAAVATVFGLVFVAGTLAVRAVILAARAPRSLEARSTRAAVLLLSGVAGVALASAAMRGVLPWTALCAAAPGLGVAAWLAVVSPQPTRLRRIGWALVAVTAAGALILVAGLSAG